MRLRSFLVVPLALLALQVKDGGTRLLRDIPSLFSISFRVANYEVRDRLCLRNVTVCQPNVDDCTCQCRVVETCTTNVSPPRTNRSVCVAALVQSGCPDRTRRENTSAGGPRLGNALSSFVECGKFYFGCEKLSDRECQCSWVKGCANEQDFDTAADCEAQLTHLRVGKGIRSAHCTRTLHIHTYSALQTAGVCMFFCDPLVAKEKCPIPVLSQYHPRHVCSSRKQTFCEYKSDCDSKRYEFRR